ncbi:MAG: condensation domain-containing protein, partial [Bacteroidota bacterium]
MEHVVQPRIDDVYALSPMQKGMLFHTIYAPGAGEHINQLQWRFVGNLDVDAFKGAWAAIVAQHDILRTAFVWEGQEDPRQAVLASVDIRWVEQDWRALDEAEQQRRLGLFVEADRKKGFNLARPPLMRFLLIRTAEDEYLFHWSHHHILVDGWSVAALFGEVHDAYKALRSGQRPQRTRATPYRTYIEWLEEQDHEAGAAFWRQELAGDVKPTSLGLQAGTVQRGMSNDGPPSRVRVSLSPESTAQLREAARSMRVTLNTMVQGAWALLLSRYSGEQDVLFGAVASGRSPEVKGVESMIGLFINTLPVRVAVDEDEQVGTWLQALQAHQAKARRYDFFPLYEMQRDSGLSHESTLFESILAFENYPVQELEAMSDESALQIGDVHLQEQTNYPITVEVTGAESLTCSALFSAQRFAESEVERVLEHLGLLLKGMAASPEARLSELALLTPTQRLALLECAAGPPLPDRPFLPLHRALAAQARRTPERVALVAPDTHLTYAALAARARRLAYILFTSGSTGRPKGAMVEQRGLVNHLLAKVDALALDPTAVVAQTARLSFDISIWQGFAALVAG